MRTGDYRRSNSFFNTRIYSALSITLLAVTLSAIATVTQFKALQNHAWYELAFQQLRDDAHHINIRAYQLVYAPTSDARSKAAVELRQSLANLAHDMDIIASTDSDGQEGGKLAELKNDHPWLFGEYTSTRHGIDAFPISQQDIEFPENLNPFWEDREDEIGSTDDDTFDYSQYALKNWDPSQGTDKVEALCFTLLNLGGRLAVPNGGQGQDLLELGNEIGQLTELKIIPALTVMTDIMADTRQDKQQSLLFILLVSAFMVLVAAGINTMFIFRPMRRTIVEALAALAKAAKTAQSADKAKSTFLANMSHEIRTPINGILGMAQILEKGNLDPKQRDFVRMLIDSGKNLLVIINDVLDFSRIEAGKIDLNPRPTDLGRLIEETVVALAISRPNDCRVEVIFKIQPSLPRTVMVDAERLRQIVTNIFGNAMKFTENGHILTELRGEVSDKGSLLATIQVTDTGCGIDAEALPSLFTRFTQADNEHNRTQQGSGLGLSICKQLTELMDGEVTAYSQVNLGSCFTVTLELPIVDEAPDVFALPKTGGKQECLIIEGNSLARSCLADCLKAWELTAHTASNIREGINKIQQLNLSPTSHVLVILSADILEREKAELVSLYARARNIYTIVTQWRGSGEPALTNGYSSLYKPFTRDQLVQELAAGLRGSQSKKAGISAGKIQNSETIQPVNIKDTDRKLAIVDAKNIEKYTGKKHPVPEPTFSVSYSPDASPLTLLVDDNPMNLRVGTEILSLLGQRFITAENGQEALELVKSHRPDIILMDISMPILDGLEATRMIRDTETGAPRAVIIGMTAHAMPEDRKKCFDHGMDDYLSKPVSFDDVEALYAKWAKYERKDRQSE